MESLVSNLKWMVQELLCLFWCSRSSWFAIYSLVYCWTDFDMKWMDEDVFLKLNLDKLLCNHMWIQMLYIFAFEVQFIWCDSYYFNGQNDSLHFHSPKQFLHCQLHTISYPYKKSIIHLFLTITNCQLPIFLTITRCQALILF